MRYRCALGGLVEIGSGARWAMALGMALAVFLCADGGASRQRRASEFASIDYEVFFLAIFDSLSRAHSEHDPRAYTHTILMIIGVFVKRE